MVTVRFRPLSAGTATYARVGYRRARVTRRCCFDGVGVCHEATGSKRHISSRNSSFNNLLLGKNRLLICGVMYASAGDDRSQMIQSYCICYLPKTRPEERGKKREVKGLHTLVQLYPGTSTH
ncbi:uncharacterized protein LOC132952940 [Metopolophium dirhodum]|uniref:uncharacterized protein LOC132952940 n=1 Tax=Metopolophium dirhodum TaxID=44670 RepID=UPI00299079E2|nr:uncharacterized protein LOC132952940 [Metopolophium dirhodum]